MMTIDPQDLYVSLGTLVANPPAELSRANAGSLSSSTHEWMGKAHALIMELGSVVDGAQLSGLHDQLSKFSPKMTSDPIFAILYRALGTAELRAPASARGAFINAGSALDAMAAVGRVLSKATTVVRIIDPYMDEKAVTDFAVLAAPTVRVELLSDSQSVKPGLQPAMGRWRQQYASRSIEGRVTPPRALHDRLIVVDGTTAYTLTQSLNAFAARSPASILLVDAETAALKIPAYDQFWLSAKPIP
jgi:hypothetical protein